MIIPSDYACNDLIHFARDGGSLYWRARIIFVTFLMAVAISRVTPAVVQRLQYVVCGTALCRFIPFFPTSVPAAPPPNCPWCFMLALIVCRIIPLSWVIRAAHAGCWRRCCYLLVPAVVAR